MLSYTLILCDSPHVPKETELRTEHAGKRMIPITWMHIYIQNKPTNSWEEKKTVQQGNCGRDFLNGIRKLTGTEQKLKLWTLMVKEKLSDNYWPKPVEMYNSSRSSSSL